jgi:hypothetical protein
VLLAWQFYGLRAAAAVVFSALGFSFVHAMRVAGSEIRRLRSEIRPDIYGPHPSFAGTEPAH